MDNPDATEQRLSREQLLEVIRRQQEGLGHARRAGPKVPLRSLHSPMAGAHEAAMLVVRQGTVQQHHRAPPEERPPWSPR